MKIQPKNNETRKKKDDSPPTLSRKIRLNTPDALDRLAGGAEVPVVRAGDPPLARVLGVDLHRILAAELGEHLVHRRRCNPKTVSHASLLLSTQISNTIR